MAQQEITNDEMYGITKKISRELEALPLHTHHAIVELLKVGKDHRNLAMQFANQQEQKTQQERVLAIQEAQIQMQKEAAQKQAITQIGLVPPN
jgi:hypothetical protein